MALERLEIQEAVGKEIKLTNVPVQGATARIPLPPFPDPNGSIEVLIADQVVAQQPVGEPESGFYKVLVPRSGLLNHTGLNKAFSYILYNEDGNAGYSESTRYDILHS
ncbi:MULTISPECIES: hypothetical protein [unclassified Pseudomonas]|jgi:hypothetical protein|uniref:hypothetical protein n=1 Tax=unclassified Pseudomonas TaxID=196821 RepID=UPI000C87DA9C|nr:MULTISPECIES: hypothetical protein [unclassified Pseudomonas]PMU08732.1 hypothetical protein C1Y11_20605 [Pseudomonas sp. FW305-20]PMU16495.1 hypothetical protein C1Y10_19275 [Pseudomonas sp. FW305-122]PMU40762.1 hypothetical protein C1Y12_10265 [Pseudomonas sp. FW305-47B]PMX58401.1 hypothetical protein C1Y13_20815 [Pseudomonas sp. FW305-33]PMX66699.1 hypothetical protein C1X12_16155 [Pseudomonas sp. FW305-60]